MDFPGHLTSINLLNLNKTPARKAPSFLVVAMDLEIPLTETAELVVGLGAHKAVWLQI